jgi:hypothetical protein
MKHLFYFLALIITTNISAQPIFSNPITGTNPSTANPYTLGQVVDPNLTASGVGRGAGAVAATANDRYSANSWNTTALDPTAYFEFTLTPAAGYEMDLVSLVYTSQASGTGATAFALRSSLDAYAANITAPAVAGGTQSLAGASFQNLTAAITFRIFAWGASASTGTYSVNDFTFNGVVSLIPFPISLKAFDVATKNNVSILSFTTASERNSSHFEIERSADGKTFRAIGEVEAAGESDIEVKYTYTDVAPLKGINYYRLKQVDLDGTFEYSKVVTAFTGRESSMSIIPTVVIDQINVSIDAAAQDGNWEIIDAAGRTVLSGTIAAEQESVQTDLTGLQQGAYVVRVLIGEEVMTQRVMKL